MGIVVTLFSAMLAIPQAIALQVAQTDKLTASDSLAGDRFGAALALFNDLLVVGAPGVDGAGQAVGSVYVYLRNVGGAELWAEQAELIVSELSAGDSFGTAVVLHDDLIAVGAPGDDSQGSNSGAVYLFRSVQGNPQRWQGVAKLTSPIPSPGQQFGQVLATDGKQLIVAAPFADDERGAVYSFVATDSNGIAWRLSGQLQGDGAGERFGASLALHDSMLAVGSPLSASDGQPVGAIHLFRREPGIANGWERLTTLRGERPGGGFGTGVALTDRWLAAGVSWENDAQGAVRLYRPVVGSPDWQLISTLRAPDRGADQRFGSSIAINSDTLVVGASLSDAGGANAGTVYIYERDPTSAEGWHLDTEFRGEDTVEGDQFGGVLASHGSTIVVGVPNDSDVGVESGAAYAFVRRGSGWEEVEKVVADAAQANDQFGFSVSLSGETLVVGAHFDSDRGVDAGSAYVFERGVTNARPWVQQTRLLAAGTQGFDRFGQAVTQSGDNLVIGALGDDGDGADSGAVFLFGRDQRSPELWRAGARVSAADADAGDSFGNAIALDRDLLLVGAFADDEGGNGAGAAYLFRQYLGEEPPWQQIAKLLADDASATHQFGISVDLAANTAVVGAHFDSHAGSFSGSAYVFQAQPKGVDVWEQTAKLTAGDAAANDQFGYSVAIYGDLVAVGAPGKAALNGPAMGAVYLFRWDHSRGQWDQTHLLQAEDGAKDDQFGFSVDLDENWLVVGARRHDAAAVDAGAVYVFGRNQGGTDRWGLFSKLSASDARPDARFGEAVSVDFNTLVVGAPFDSHAGARSGAAYVFGLSP